MSRRMYGKLAWNNIRQNRQFYLPYFITGMLMVGMYYIICALRWNEGLLKVQSGDNLKVILDLGSWVIMIFAAIFIFYTNSFIIKRRKKELGLYNILGMEKRHIARIMLRETLLTILICAVGGIVTGMVFYKLMTMLLYKLMGFATAIGFYISVRGILVTVVLFTVIYLVTLLYNLLQVKLANPIELLRSGSEGEREPKTKLWMALIGAACLGTGYFIAITTENPVRAMTLFFLAVVLVIIGTYFLFIAGSIAILKLLRKNRGYYYQPRHFTAVSGMLYRMKQNAAGLASICILSTVVLLMISGTVSLFLGVEDELHYRFPWEISVNARYDGETDSKDALEKTTLESIGDSGRTVLEQRTYAALIFAAMKKGDAFGFGRNMDDLYTGDAYLFSVYTRSDYQKASGGDVPELGENEVLIGAHKEELSGQLKIADETFAIRGKIDPDAMEDEQNSYMMEMTADSYTVVVRDEAAMQKFYALQKKALGNMASQINVYICANIDGTKEEMISCEDELEQTLNERPADGTLVLLEARQKEVDSFRAMYGGMFFLGLFLGAMFLIETVLIIFYKQISEGYEDKERFCIMEKVGMSSDEVRGTIRSQVRTVFLLPILMAVVHTIAAFPMIKRLLILVNLNNTRLFTVCTVGTILVFTGIYVVVFLVTSRVYYRIVGRQV